MNRDLFTRMKRGVLTGSWAVIGAALLVMTAAGCGQSPSPQEGSAKAPRQETALPSVVLIVADAFRADRLGARRSGVELTPNLAQFAKESWNFTDVTVQATWTRPSMTSIFTSLYPGVHRVLFGVGDSDPKMPAVEVDVLPKSLPTMATYLKEHGYHTSAIQTNVNISEPLGFAQGFDSYFFKWYPSIRANEVTDKALETLAGLAAPFFLYVHYMDTHAPYDPPVQYLEEFGPPPAISLEEEGYLKDYPTYYSDLVLNEIGVQHERKYRDLSANAKELLRYKYDGGVRFVDAEASRLIRQVRVKYPDAIIIFTADHGEELWDHGSIGHGKTVYQELTRVPLVISRPGAPPQTFPAPVESVDILPTLAAVLGFEPSPNWQGCNLGGVTLDPTRPVFSMTRTSFNNSSVNLESVLVGHYKWISDLEKSLNSVYDLDMDPREQHPLTTLPAAQETALRADLKNRHQLDDAHPLRQAVPMTTGLDEGARQQLESIGYGK